MARSRCRIEAGRDGLMRRRKASINEHPTADADRRLDWQPLGPRPDDFPGLAALGF